MLLNSIHLNTYNCYAHFTHDVYFKIEWWFILKIPIIIILEAIVNSWILIY